MTGLQMFKPMVGNLRTYPLSVTDSWSHPRSRSQFTVILG